VRFKIIDTSIPKNLEGDILRTLYEMKKNEEATIIKVNAKGALKERLTSFGVVKGSILEVKNCSLTRDNIEIDVNGVFIALRKSEAELIGVSKDE
jgi:ferrous iron transport protein A